MRMKSLNISAQLLLVLILSTSVVKAQTTLADYKRADSLFQNNDRVYSSNIQATWIPETHIFWYINSTKKGKEFLIVDAEKGTKTAAFDQDKLAGKISEVTGKKLQPGLLWQSIIRIKHNSFSASIKEYKTLMITVKSINILLRTNDRFPLVR